MTPVRLLAVVAAGTLTACSGGGADPATPGELYNEAGALLSGALDAGNTPAAEMPVSGSATYEGVLALGAPPGAVTPQQVFDAPDLLGALALTADFGAATIAGRAQDFRASDGADYDGSLAITGGAISGTGFRGDIAGTLEHDDAETVYDGDVTGSFFGPDADSLVGTIVTVATPEGGSPRVTYGAVVAD